MAQIFDPYDVLDVPRNATDAEIRAAQKDLVQEVHPDTRGRNLSPERRARLTRKTAQINRAAQILVDPKKRRAIDDELDRGASSSQSASPPPRATPQDPATLRTEIAAEQARLAAIEKTMRTAPTADLAMRRAESVRRLDNLRQLLALAEQAEAVKNATDTDPDYATHPRSDHRVAVLRVLGALARERSRAKLIAAARAVAAWFTSDPNGMWATVLGAVALTHFVLAPSISDGITIVNGVVLSWAYALPAGVLAAQHWFAGRRCHKPTTALISWAKMGIVGVMFLVVAAIEKPALAGATLVAVLALLAFVAMGPEAAAVVIAGSLLIWFLASDKTAPAPSSAGPANTNRRSGAGGATKSGKGKRSGTVRI